MNEPKCNPHNDVNEDHLVKNQHIKLSITVGEGKVDCHEVSLNSSSEVICEDIDDYPIDLGSEIESTTLFITSNISNNTNSEFASITYILSDGGVASKTFPKTKEFNGQSTVCITAEFNFEQINSNHI